MVTPINHQFLNSQSNYSEKIKSEQQYLDSVGKLELDPIKCEIDYERQVFPSSLENKNIVVSDGNQEKARPVFASNKIRTAMYTRLNFYPKSLMLQFTKLANVYWGICTLLLFYEPIRVANPGFVFFFLSIVIHVGIFKEWMSDVKRQKADSLVNNKIYQRVTELNDEGAPNIVECTKC